MKKRGPGSGQGRAALLHAIAHIEFNAIDLAWDIIARFGARFDRAFADDWVRVGDDEARHFQMLSGLMARDGLSYGDFPAHDGLWQAAEATAHCPAARLAVVPMVLEARGLDVTPGMVEKFSRAGDAQAAAVLSVILNDEVSHVAAGRRWFETFCKAGGHSPDIFFQQLVRKYYQGQIRPPFNEDARAQAGLMPDWYQPLAV